MIESEAHGGSITKVGGEYRSGHVLKPHEALEAVPRNHMRARARRKKWKDSKPRDRPFEAGDEVLLMDGRVSGVRTPKLKRPWMPGCRIVRRMDSLSFQVEHPNGWRCRLQVHVNRLRKQELELVWPQELNTWPTPSIAQEAAAGTLIEYLDSEHRRHSRRRPSLIAKAMGTGRSR